MAFTAVAAVVATGAAVYSADQQRKIAHQQADAQSQAAADAAKQAAESARGNALASQAASERQAAEANAEANAKQAASEAAVMPDVQPLATADPAEAARRRQVRASFTLNPDDAIGGGGSIRV